jgi:RNA polymerase primary sigma factor
VTYPKRHRRGSEVLNMLLEKASIQGYLTTDDLVEVYPDAGQDSERLSVIMLALRNQGVEILDGEIDDQAYSDDVPVGSRYTFSCYR